MSSSNGSAGVMWTMTKLDIQEKRPDINRRPLK